MSEKKINSRLINKHDIEINWAKATGFIPKNGEFIVYDPDEIYSYARFKIGDGKTNINNLPFTVSPDDIEKIYIGTEKPTDENAKIWVDTDEALTGSSQTTELSWVECKYALYESGVIYRCTDGVRKTGDSLVSYDSYKINIVDGTEYRVTACIAKPATLQALVTFYKADGAYISYYGRDESATTETRFIEEPIEIPDGAAYMMVGHYTYFGDEFRVEEGVTITLSSIAEEVQVVAQEVQTLKDNINNNGSLNGLTIVNFGDSIFGKRRPPDDISTELAKLTGATVHNCGFGGCKMVSHSNVYFKPFSMIDLVDSIVANDWTAQDNAISSDASGVLPTYFSEGLDILKSLDFTNVDIITIAYGTNDFADGIVLDNDENKADITAFAGALRYSIEQLLTAYPHLRIFVCGQIYRFWMDTDGNFVDDSNSHTNSKGKTLIEFIAKTKEVAEEYHTPFIDNYNIGMNKFNRSQYFSATDGTHPILAGNKLIARHIAKELF